MNIGYSAEVSGGERSAVRRFSATELFLGAALGAMANYYILYLKSIGISDMQAGILLGLVNIMALSGRFFWSYLCDQFQRCRLFVITAFILAGAIAIIIWGLPGNALWPKLILFGIQSFFFYPCTSLVDSWFFKRMGKYGGNFGAVKLWCSLGSCLVALIAGQMIDRLGWNWLFILFLSFCTGSILSSFFVPDVVKVKREKQEMVSLRPLIVNKDYVFIVLWGTFGMIAACLVANFTVLASNRLGASAGFFGQLILMCGLFEIGIYKLTPRMLRHIGPLAMLAASMLSYCIDGFFIAYAGTPWQLFLAIPFQGMGGALYLFSMKYYISTLVPNELKISAQSMAEALYYGLGGMISGFLGGILISSFGMATEQIIGAVLCILCVAVLLSVQYVLWRRRA